MSNVSKKNKAVKSETISDELWTRSMRAYRKYCWRHDIPKDVCEISRDASSVAPAGSVGAGSVSICDPVGTVVYVYVPNAVFQPVPKAEPVGRFMAEPLSDADERKVTSFIERCRAAKEGAKPLSAMTSSEFKEALDATVDEMREIRAGLESCGLPSDAGSVQAVYSILQKRYLCAIKPTA